MREDKNENRWDKLLQIHTMGRDDSRSDLYRYPYEPTPYCVLERMANTGMIRKGNTLLNYGCGKGRVDFFLSAQTRCQSIGVEYDDRIYAFSEAASIFGLRQLLWGLKGASSPFLATATTAACGGNREELLGPRSAGHECRPRHEVDAGYRNPSDPARRNRWCFSGSLLARKRELSLSARALQPAPQAQKS